MKNNCNVTKELSNKNSIKIIICLIISGLIIRFYFTPFNLPINLDAIDYFAYAVAMSREGIFPSGYILTNFGWSSFLSIVFSFFKESEMLELMNIQRILNTVISVLAIIPIYLLVKTFFRKEIALLGATLFLFDPRIIQNSILGGTDSLFILFTILAILFIFLLVEFISTKSLRCGPIISICSGLTLKPEEITYLSKREHAEIRSNLLVFVFHSFF